MQKEYGNHYSLPVKLLYSKGFLIGHFLYYPFEIIFRGKDNKEIRQFQLSETENRKYHSHFYLHLTKLDFSHLPRTESFV